MQTSPQAKRVLCFGDSNTWGYIYDTKHNRYPVDVRWTGVLQNLLGGDYEIIEEGLNSRGIVKGDSRPGKEGRIAMDYIIPCLDTHDPLDYVVVMLGSNELKAEFNLSAQEVGDNLKMLIDVITNRSSQFREVKPQIVIVVPPVLDETTEYSSLGDKYKGAYEKSKALRGIYAKVAEETDSLFLDIQDQLEVGSDGVHLLPEAHKVLAQAICNLLKL